MTTKSLLHSSLLDNQYYTSMLAGNTAYEPAKEFELLQTVDLTSNQASVTMTGLDQFSNYKNLQLRISARTLRNSWVDSLLVRVNGDTGGNGVHWITTNRYSGTLDAEGYSGQNGIIGFAGTMLTDYAADTNAWGLAIVNILNPYDTGTGMHFMEISAGMDDASGRTQVISLGSSSMQNTSPLSELYFTGYSGGFSLKSGSRISLYGIG